MKWSFKLVKIQTLFLLLLLLPIPLFLSSAASAASSDSITIEDPVLEKIVRSLLGKPSGPITAEDAARITEIDTSKSYDAMAEGAQNGAGDGSAGMFPGIQSLEGLQHFAHLQRLYIAPDYTHSFQPEHRIKDVAPLSKLSKLEDLTISSASLKSLDDLQNLNNLKRLTLQYNGELSDLKPLGGLTSLEELDLTGNHVADLSPIGHLPKLHKLELDANPLVDLEPLRGLKGLTELSFADLTLASDNPHPKPIGLKPLSGLTGLVKLNMEAARVADLAPIKPLSRLEELDAGQNPNLLHPETVSSFPNLTRLSLPAVGLKDVEPLTGLTKLESLDISMNQIETVDPLRGLSRLRTFNAAANRLSSLAVIKAWPELEYAHFSHNLLVSLEGVQPGPKLKLLDIEGNIVDYRELSGSAAVIQRLKEAGAEVLFTTYEPFPDILFRQTQDVYVLGKFVKLNEAPFNNKGRFYVPLRFVSETLGAGVKWDKSAHKVTIHGKNRELELTIGEKTILVNGKRVETDAAPMMVGGTTFVPVRFVSEQLGIYVQSMGNSAVGLILPD
ncbi:stalk domain-containing protein [Paenibacillus macerans]|uniref:stalk domain-containing protein n=1 Tax=Paenibacillus macerans TaxID=44252 RepID=UPI002DBF5676|nr:stalk domain-containing protein [Paenibacillus macerans]MEC0330745.1 stalk domain-containing protein [Paenibacillus macerans]